MNAQEATPCDNEEDADVILVMGKAKTEKEVSLMGANFFLKTQVIIAEATGGSCCFFDILFLHTTGISIFSIGTPSITLSAYRLLTDGSVFAYFAAKQGQNISPICRS